MENLNTAKTFMLDAADLAQDPSTIATSYDNSKKILPVNSVVNVEIVDAYFADIHIDNQGEEGAECIAVVMQMTAPEIVSGFKITKKFKLRHTDDEQKKKAKDQFLVLDKILGGHILAAMKQGQPVTDSLLKQHFMFGATRISVGVYNMGGNMGNHVQGIGVTKEPHINGELIDPPTPMAQMAAQPTGVGGVNETDWMSQPSAFDNNAPVDFGNPEG